MSSHRCDTCRFGSKERNDQMVESAGAPLPFLWVAEATAIKSVFPVTAASDWCEEWMTADRGVSVVGRF